MCLENRPMKIWREKCYLAVEKGNGNSLHRYGLHITNSC